VQIPDHLTYRSTDAASVSNQSPTRRKRVTEEVEAMNENMHLIGSSMRELADVEKEALMNRLEESKLELQFKMEDFKGIMNMTKVTLCEKRVVAIDMKIKSLESELISQKTKPKEIITMNSYSNTF